MERRFYLYTSIGIIRGCNYMARATSVLLTRNEYFGLDYREGFLLATVLQVSRNYLGNKFLVFKS